MLSATANATKYAQNCQNLPKSTKGKTLKYRTFKAASSLINSKEMKTNFFGN
jgi:hypothetical protein